MKKIMYWEGASIRGLPLSTYALRGRGGVGPNADVVLRLSKRGCVNLRTRGGRGVKKAGKSAYVLYGCPLTKCCSESTHDRADGANVLNVWKILHADGYGVG